MVSLLGPTNPAFEPGTLLGQIVDFPIGPTGPPAADDKTLHKVSLTLSVSSKNRTLFHIGENDFVSFAASNFSTSRDEWMLQPVVHWAAANDWETSGTSIRNTLQTTSYSSVAEAVASAAYLEYSFFVPEEGVYTMYGFGVAPSGIYWSLDGDTSDLRTVTLGAGPKPSWVKFGNFEVNEGGLHTFRVYLGTDDTVILDQWYFTTDPDLLSQINTTKPLPVSRGPFNTIIRLRNLNNGVLDDFETPIKAPISCYLPSRIITANGRYNYEIQNSEAGSGVLFASLLSNGLSIEFWQVGGGIDDYASWDFSFPDSSVGSAFFSSDYGETITYV